MYDVKYEKCNLSIEKRKGKKYIEKEQRLIFSADLEGGRGGREEWGVCSSCKTLPPSVYTEAGDGALSIETICDDVIFSLPTWEKQTHTDSMETPDKYQTTGIIHTGMYSSVTKKSVLHASNLPVGLSTSSKKG